MITATLAIAAALVATSPASAINAHYKSLGSPHTARYLDMSRVDPEIIIKWHNALRFAVPSASRATNLDHQIPQRLKGTAAYYINLESLAWGFADLNKILEAYPYDFNDPAHPLLSIRGDWLIATIADPRKSDALYRLLYGGDKIPKTSDEFLAFWGVSQDNGQQIGQQYGWIEGQSQVNKKGARLLKRYNARGLSLWETNDSKQVTRATDPAEQLQKAHKHDGRELIAQFMKTSVKDGTRSAAQAYLLADGTGKVVQEAPTDLVEDFTRTFDEASIVTHSSCIHCHTEGMKKPTTNLLKGMLASGVELKAYSQQQREAIEEFYLSDVYLQLERDNENYRRFVKACNGLTTEANAANYKDVIAAYGKPLRRKDAARELSCTERELTLAAGYASAEGVIIGNQFASMIHGGTIARSQWEEDYRQVREILKVWINHQATQPKATKTK